jgi:outer membrane protein
MREKKSSLVRKSIALMLIGGAFVLGAPQVGASALEISLDDSVALTLKNNESVKIAASEKLTAAELLAEAQTGYQPRLDYTFSGSRAGANSSATHIYSVGNQFGNQVGLSLPLYTGGSVEGQINQAKLGLTSADLAIADAKQQLKLQATTGYFAVMQAQNLVKVNQDTVNDLQAHLTNVQAQFAVGTVAKSDVLRSQVAVANAQQTLIQAQNTYDLAVSSLNNVMGLPMDTQIHLKDQLQYTKYNTPLADCVSYALQHRPDGQQADISIASAKEGITIAESGNKPQVNLSADEGWSDTHPLGTKNNSWSIGASASWNLFDAGLTKSKIRSANVAVDKASQQAQQTKDTIQLDVRQAYLSLKNAEKRISTTQVAVDQAQEDYKIAQVRYSSGVGTNLDVMDAEAALLTAKTNSIQALYDYNTSKAQLDKAMGIAVN